MRLACTERVRRSIALGPKFAQRSAVSYKHRMPPQRSCIRPNRSLCSSAAFFALALGAMSAPAPALADQPAHVEHSEHDELSEPEAHASSAPKRLLDVYDASSDVRRLLRNGGHGRPGFDDIAWPDAISLPYAQIVDPERYIPGTVSLGTTSDGHLLHGARVPLDGHAHHVLHEHRGRPTHYGTEEIVALVLDAAEHYAARYPGERIALGNFSEHEGGDIRWSRSHNSGRDADIAFPFVDEDSEPVTLDTLLYASSRGAALDGSGHRVDFERAWTIVEGLLTSEAAHVQWIFVYAPLKRRILQAGEALGADAELLEAARDVLHQPGDSAPHNDHFHVRIFCPRDDALEGCVDVGPRREFAPDWSPLVEARVHELERGLMDADPHVANACSAFLERLGAEERLEALARALPHQPPEAQLASIEAIAMADEPGYAAAMIPLAESSPHDEVRRQAFWALGRLADVSTAAGLAGVVARDGEPLADGTPAREAAAHAMRNIPNEAAVDALLTALDDPRPEVRAAVQHALRRVTLADDPHDASGELSERASRELDAFWRKWSRERRDEGRALWLEREFAAAGYDVGSPDNPDLGALVEALADDRDAIRFAADRLLVEHTRYWSPSERWTRIQRLRFWQARVD